MVFGFTINQVANLILETRGLKETRQPCPQRFEGFDIFWYNWSLNNPETKLLK